MSSFHHRGSGDTQPKKATNKRPFSRRLLFTSVLIIIAIGLMAVLDLFLGQVNDIAIIRESSRMFRDEAVFLRIKTRYLLPNISHRYQLEAIKAGRSRYFRTGPLGGVLGIENEQMGGAIDILFLGGSTTETNEVSESVRFPYLVGESLSAMSDQKYRGINFGVRGNTSRDSLNLLLNHPVSKSASYVVLMHNINDRLLLSIEGSYDARIDHNLRETSSANLVNSGLGFLWVFWDDVSYRSNILFATRKYIFDINPWTGERNDVVSEEVIDYTIKDMESTLALFRESLLLFTTVVNVLGKEPVLMTQPLGRKSREQDAFNEVIRAVAREADVILVDLDSELPVDRGWLFLSDDIHLNDVGSSEVARVIAARLGSILLENESDSNFVSAQELSSVSKCNLTTSDRIPFISKKVNLLLRADGRYPVFFADEETVIFQTYRHGRELVRAFSRENEQYLKITPTVSEYNDRHAVPWEPNVHGKGRWVVFGRNEGSVERLFSKNIDSVQPARELPIPKNISSSIPSVSPDGEIHFAGSLINENREIMGSPDLYRFDQSSGETKQLTDTKWEEWRPVTSPDGQHIYYIANPDRQFDIFRLDLVSGKIEKVWGSEEDEWDPDISPDGQWLLYASKQAGNWDIYMLDLEASDRTPIQLTYSSADEWDPRFLPSGTGIVFASSAGDVAPKMMHMCMYGEH